MNNILYRILGLVLVGWGLRVCIDPVYYSTKYDMRFDFSEINISFGLIVALLGGYFVWSSFSKK